MQVEKSANEQGQWSLSEEMTLVHVYEQFRGPIYAYTYRLLGSREDADDMTQEVFARACVLWQSLTDREHLSSWLYRIATNICLDCLRRRKRFHWRSIGTLFLKKAVENDTIDREITSILSNLGGIPEVAERELIHLALKQLSPEHVVVLVLHSIQGLPYQQIAEIIAVTPQTAATRISRAKKQFIRAYTILSQDESGKRGKENAR